MCVGVYPARIVYVRRSSASLRLVAFAAVVVVVVVVVAFVVVAFVVVVVVVVVATAAFVVVAFVVGGMHVCCRLTCIACSLKIVAAR